MLEYAAVVTVPALLAPERSQAKDGADLQFEPVDRAGTTDPRAVAGGALAIPLKELAHEAGDPRVLKTDFNAHSSALYNRQFLLRLS